jgi:hypothetical protein
MWYSVNCLAEAIKQWRISIAVYMVKWSKNKNKGGVLITHSLDDEIDDEIIN